MATIRGYLTDKQFQNITGADSLGTDADLIIAKAEAIIDGYIGNWQPHFNEIVTVPSSAQAGEITLNAQDRASLPGVDYLKGLAVEFLNGEAAGETRIIESQGSDGVITFDQEFSDEPADGDIVRIYQAGKVPRRGTDDVISREVINERIYIRNIPQPLREAVAAQIQYMQELGDEFFDGQASSLDSESMQSYSYQRGESAKGGKAMVAPKVRQLLAGTGIINRTAQIVG